MSSPISNDLSNAPRLGGRRLSPEEDQRFRKSLSDFESHFTKQLMKAMRKTVGEAEEGFFKKSNGEKMFQDMLDGQYADISSKGEKGLGIKETLYQHLTGLPFKEKSETEVKDNLDETVEKAHNFEELTKTFNPYVDLPIDNVRLLKK